MAAPTQQSHSERAGNTAKVAGLVLAALLAAGVNAGALRRADRLRAAWPAEADTFYLPPSNALRIASLGHRELAADLLHGKANVYFGTQVLAKMPAKWLARYINTAIDLDPQFHRLYLSGATMIVYTGQKIEPEMLFTANEILERGRKNFPLDWELPFQLGFNYLYELPQAVKEADARIPVWRQKGLEFLQYAAQFDGVPYYIPSLVARLLTKNGSVELAIGQLERAYSMTSNEQARRAIHLKLVSLQGKHTAERLELQRQDFLRLIAKSYPFVPEAFGVVVGPLTTIQSFHGAPASVPPAQP